eukprot:COSAG02_NODE_121_length_35326_cov_25.450819_27_plen_146_part_00
MMRSEEQAGISATNDNSAHDDAYNRVVAKRWVYLMLCGGVVQQAGWRSLHGNLGWWGGLAGMALVCVGAVGFDCCVPGHGPQWKSGARNVFWGFIVFWALWSVGTSNADADNVHLLAGLMVLMPCVAMVVSCEEICRMEQHATSR